MISGGKNLIHADVFAFSRIEIHFYDGKIKFFSFSLLEFYCIKQTSRFVSLTLKVIHFAQPPKHNFFLEQQKFIATEIDFVKTLKLYYLKHQSGKESPVD